VAFFHQPGGRQPFLRAPAVVLALAAVLLAIEAVSQFVFPDDRAQLFVQFGFVPARYSHAFLATHLMNGGSLFDRALPFVSYIFLHADWTHVAINTIWLLPFGTVVARRYGVVLFLLFFLLCGIAGAAFHLTLNWGSTSPVIGASAAVSGLMGAAFRMMPEGPYAPLHPLFSRIVIIWSVVWIALNAVVGITGFGTGPGIHTVAWEAHIGGYFAGLLLAGPLDALRALRLPRQNA
jgi:membrane associated rhomboid family serine protease